MLNQKLAEKPGVSENYLNWPELSPWTALDITEHPTPLLYSHSTYHVKRKINILQIFLAVAPNII